MLVEATLDFPEEELDFLEASDARGQLAVIRANLAGVLAQARQGALLREACRWCWPASPTSASPRCSTRWPAPSWPSSRPSPHHARPRARDHPDRRHPAAYHRHRRPARRHRRRSRAHRHPTHLGRRPRRHRAAPGRRHRLRAQRPVPIDDQIDDRLSGVLPPGSPILRVVNKIDLAPPPATRTSAATARTWSPPTAPIPAKSGSPRAAAPASNCCAPTCCLVGWQSSGNEGTFLARERHLTALRNAQSHLDMAAEQADQQAGARPLRRGTAAGAGPPEQHHREFTSDDLLGTIFTRFCIGK